MKPTQKLSIKTLRAMGMALLSAVPFAAQADLIALWDFEEGSGTASEAYTSTAGAFVGTADFAGSAVAPIGADSLSTLSAGDHFDSNMDADAIPGFGGTGAKTIVAWFNTSTSSNATLFNYSPTLGVTAGGDIRLFVQGNGDLRVEASSGAGSVLGGTSLNDGNDHMVALIFNAGENFNDIDIFVDGTLYTNPLSAGNNAAMNLGGSGSNIEFGLDHQGNRGFVGSIDDVAIYDEALDETALDDLELNGIAAPQLATIDSFEADPVNVFGIENVTLDWTTQGAGRLVINDGSSDIATFTTTADTQAFLDSGSFVVNNVSASTTYTLTATVAEDGSGELVTSQASVTAYPQDPDLTAVAVPFVSAGPTNVTLFFNATVISTLGSEVASSFIDDFLVDDGNPANGFELRDSTQDFDSLLNGGSAYVFRPLNGAVAGQDSSILSWAGDTLVIADDHQADLSWYGEYAIFEVTYLGADSLVINDGSSDVFTTTDPAVIASGPFDAGLISSNTTFTVTASNSASGGSSQEILPVVIGGSGASYVETVMVDAPVGYYRLEENTGTTLIYDSSGNGNHSTQIIGTPTYGEAGAIGRAVRMNNAEGVFVDVNLDPAASDWTVEGIVRPDFVTVPPGSREQLSIWSNANGSGTGRTVLYAFDDTRDLRSFTGGAVSPDEGTATVINQTPLVNDCWSHVALTGTDNLDGTYTLRFYIDGVLEAEQPGVVPEAADGNWIFGSHKSGSNAVQFFLGLMDEMAIYDTALAPARVTAHYDALLAESSQLLSFSSSTMAINSGESVDLTAIVGGGATSASIDNGIGVVPLGASTVFNVSPTSTTTYTIDVDGVQKTVTIVVAAPAELVVEAFGLDNGSGFPFLDVSGLAEGEDYQLFTSTNLINWTGAGPVITADGTGMATFTDPNAFDSGANPALFYQVRSVTPE